MAIDYYREAAQSDSRYLEDYRRVYKQLYGHEINSNKESVGFWKAIIRVLKKIVTK